MIYEYDEIDDVDEFSDAPAAHAMRVDPSRSKSIYSSFGVMRPGIDQLNRRFSPMAR